MIQTFVFTETSPAAAGSGASSNVVQGAGSNFPAGQAGPLDDALALDIIAELVGATGGTLDVYIQTSPNEGTDWYDYAHFPQLGAGAGAVIYRMNSGTPSDTISTVGKNNAPALAANTVVGGPWGNRMRVWMVAGAGTSAGAAVKIQITAQRLFWRNNG